jgi:pimeloyl-ACP methyl ester carboxylesterase
VDKHFRVQVGPPQAKISIYLLEAKPPGGPPRGTILVLHGIFTRSLWMLGTARRLASAGYRVVLTDLRGEGSSTGEYVTYGVQEAQDISQVIDALESQGLIAGKLGVYGFSYGATTAIHLAARDPRIGAVVAVAPFGRMRDEVPHYVRTLFPLPGWLIPESKFQEAIDEAGRRAGFNPDLADAALAITQSTAPVLLIHGDADRMTPPWNSVRIHQAAPDRSELALLSGANHLSVWFDLSGQVAQYAQGWFERWLTDCPSVPYEATPATNLTLDLEKHEVARE